MCNSHIETQFNQFLMEIESLKEKYFNFIKEKIFLEEKTIKRHILANFMFHIKSENSFALYDEQIFDIYKNIIQSYKLFLCRYEKINFNFNNDIQKNLNGIIAVLNSQISFFEEKDNLGINPIITERKNIIAKYLDNIYIDIEKFLKVTFEKLFQTSNDISNEKINEIFIKYLQENIIISYKENLKSCFNSINDNENRQVISYYNDILEEEKEIFASIIKVQVKALEDLCSSQEEKQIIQDFLFPLREAYQHCKKQFDEHNKNIKCINTNLDININKDTEDIYQVLTNILNVKFEDIKLNDKLENIIIETLENKYLDLLEKANILLKDLNETKQIFEEVCNQFVKIYKFISTKTKQYESTQFNEIINGIFETINIKIENLEENKKQFLNECINIYDKINEIENFDINTILYDKDEVFNVILENDFERFLNFFDKNVLNKYFYEYNNILENTFNNIYNYKKDVILFEITTFEEILNYSVVILRESNEPIIKDIVFEIDNTTKSIQEILINKNIFRINPEPHTIFNAREHEVLLAEKNEEFKKGEIIKVLNCGYKIFDKVVIRANVIAAK